MTLGLLVLAAFVGALALYRPHPPSLKGGRPSLLANLAAVKSTLGLGVGLIAIFFLTSGFEFEESQAPALHAYGLRGANMFDASWFMQFFTSNLVHGNAPHLLANLAMLGPLSFYERRVGALRFVAVFVVGGLTSSLSVFFFDPEAVQFGASGAIFGLAAGYLADYPNLSWKEWGIASLVMVGASILLALRFDDAPMSGASVNHIAHFLGAVGALIYCRIARGAPTQGSRWATADY
jgi:membrane associated rhomboid family serine protease